MTRKSLVLAVAVLLCAGAATAPAAETKASAPEATQQVLLDALRTNRKALIAVNLDLTKEQAAAFWPVYDRYAKQMSAIGDRMLATIQDYVTHFTDLSDEKALQLVRDYVGAEAERDKVRAAFIDEFAKVLPGRTVARFYQLENKVDAVLRYDLASTIPVVETAAKPPAK
jgi:Spy/CpxP family protein refolding chaperone